MCEREKLAGSFAQPGSGPIQVDTIRTSGVRLDSPWHHHYQTKEVTNNSISSRLRDVISRHSPWNYVALCRNWLNDDHLRWAIRIGRDHVYFYLTYMKLRHDYWMQLHYKTNIPTLRKCSVWVGGNLIKNFKNNIFWWLNEFIHGLVTPLNYFYQQ